MNLNEIFDHNSSATTLPVHFLGALSQTESGANFLDTHDDLLSFVALVKGFRRLEYSESNIIKLKAAMWSLSQIAGSNFGFKILGKYFLDGDVATAFLEISKTCPSWSVRGYI